MKKVGILTINDYNNYGNRLQNYALQEFLKNLDVEVETIVNTTEFNVNKESDFKDKLSFILRNPASNIKQVVKNKYTSRRFKSEINNASVKRKDNFGRFNEYIIESQFEISESNINKKNIEEFDYFVTGSDQVWNPNFRLGSSIDFLTFADPNIRIAYAASFGVNNIPEKYVANYTKWLNEMKNISVREEAGAQIVNKLTNKEVPVLVDPTMLIKRDQWHNISQHSKLKPDSPYLLTYFLGGPSAELKNKLNKIANERNLKIINLGDRLDFEPYGSGPIEFLNLIENAEAFFMDSFHGVVFSIIFETPFVVYERNNSASSMYSRIQTILEKFDMKDREAKNFNGNLFEMDFSKSHKILDDEVIRSTDFLKNALNLY